VKARLAVGLACLIVASVGCGGDDTPTATTDAEPAAAGEFGSYEPMTSLDEKEVVETYVGALDDRDGDTFCRVVTSWISGRFDIAGTDPDASTRKPLRCPELVPVLIDFPWENQERDFKGARVTGFGDLDRRGDDLVGVPVTIMLRLDEYGRGEYDEPLEDLVWLTKETGAWRVAKLGAIAGWASLVQTERDDDLSTPPDLESERQKFAAEAAQAEMRRSAREASYRDVGMSVDCPQGRSYPDGSNDVVDYQHPAPPTPTPQLAAADIRALHVHASARRTCAVFELAGDVQTDSVFELVISSPDFDWGRAGFSYLFSVELRADGRARVTTALDDQRRPVAVEATVGRAGSRLRLEIDETSFSTGEPLPGSVAPARPLTRFDLRGDVTVRVSEDRLLHDDLGPGPPEGVTNYPYP
jgi:hypothetical protein